MEASKKKKKVLTALFCLLGFAPSVWWLNICWLLVKFYLVCSLCPSNPTLSFQPQKSAPNPSSLTSVILERIKLIASAILQAFQSMSFRLKVMCLIILPYPHTYPSFVFFFLCGPHWNMNFIPFGSIPGAINSVYEPHGNGGRRSGACAETKTQCSLVYRLPVNCTVI